MSFNISQKGEVKQNTKRNTESQVFDLGNGISRAWNENRELEDLPQANFGRVHENITFFGKEKVNN